MSARYGFYPKFLMLGAIAALVTCFAALCVVSFRRFSGRFVALAALFIARLGYAVPGIVTQWACWYRSLPLTTGSTRAWKSGLAYQPAF